MERQKPSRLRRLAYSAVIFLITSIASAAFIFLIGLVYPVLNPIVYTNLVINDIPRPVDVAWLFWVLLPGVFNIFAALVIALIMRAVIRRKNRSASPVYAGGSHG